MKRDHIVGEITNQGVFYVRSNMMDGYSVLAEVRRISRNNPEKKFIVLKVKYEVVTQVTRNTFVNEVE